MAVFKCKMCGGTLDILEGATVAECEFCGTKQTLPKLSDEKRGNLYDRANHFRRNNDYDKALSIYEQILNEDKTDAEAYWSIVLCKYGIEYVEDPSTHKRIPTVNRTQFTSVFADEDYKSAIANADGYQRDIYEAEAEAIDKIQKGILAVSSKEDPFDVFICYKETDNTGRRTKDSVLAQELYYGLKNEGFKVFFARITLEDKLGAEYEPYIFGALNSSKVMVVLGTQAEHFNAVWVKNEWKRYLALIKGGARKTLIPAYKDMDPYDMPEEFSHLQAQDMSKLGFMQDVVRGIKKIIGNEKLPIRTHETVIVENHPHDASPLIRRAYLFLEDGDFDSAEQYTEKVLDINPECPDAYLIKLLIQLKIRKVELLAQSETIISEYPNYKKAVRFADEQLSEKLLWYSEAIVQNIENKRKEEIYQSACNDMESECYLVAIEKFSKIVDYKDSATNIDKCNEFIEIERKERKYVSALGRVAFSGVNDKLLKQSIEELQTISGYRDVDEKIAQLQARLEKYYYDKKVAEERARVRAEEERLRKLREEELRKIKAEKRRQAIKKTARIGIPSVFTLALILVLTFTLFIPLGRYNKANRLVEEGKYEEAKALYLKLDGFSESENKILVVDGLEYIKARQYEIGVQRALEGGAKVEIAYELDGGGFYKEATESLGATAVSQQDSAVQTTFVYNSLSEYTGFPSPKNPTRNGYRFVGWAFSSCNAEIESEHSSVRIGMKAKWQAKNYSITYLNCFSYVQNNPTAYDADETVQIYNPTRIGYEFIGWTGTGLTEMTMHLVIPKESYGNRTYTANWQAKTYTITYDANEGELTNNKQTVTYGKRETLAVPTRKGYAFKGWYEGTTLYTNGDWETSKDVRLTAKWELIKYEIKYILDGGTATNTATYTLFDTVNLTAPKRAGYTFMGWTGTGLTQQSMQVSIPTGSTGNRTYTAHWQANVNTLRFDGNGASTGAMSDMLLSTDEEITLPNNAYEKIVNGITYGFLGWSTTPDDTAEYANGGTFVMSAEQTVVLYAVWFLDCVDEQGLVYSLSKDATYFVVSDCEPTATDIVVPETYKGLPIKEIGDNAFENCKQLETILIGANIERINGIDTFAQCDSLVGVYIKDLKNWCNIKYENWPSNPLYRAGNLYLNDQLVTDLILSNDITTIQDWAFYGCSSLRTIETSDSLTSIGLDAFFGCSNLESVYIKDIKAWCGISFVAETSNPLSYAQNLYLNNELITELVIPNDVVGVRDYAFFGCDSLSNIVIPDNVKSLGRSAFESCMNVTSITLGSGLSRTSIYAFASCQKLTQISIPTSLQKLEPMTFAGCTSLEFIFIPKSITDIDADVFIGCSSSLTIYCETETKPSGWSDDWNRNWEGSFSVVWNFTDEMDEQGVVYNLSEDKTYYTVTNYVGTATDIVIPETYKGLPVKEIGDNAFEYSAITHVVLPDSITTIGDFAVAFTPLTEIVLPNGLKSIGAGAFEDCPLKEIFIPKSVETMGDGVFAGPQCSEATIYCEAESKPDGWDDTWRSYYPNNSAIYWGVIAHGTTEDGLVWLQNSAGVSILSSSCNGTGLHIPDTINGANVVEIKTGAFVHTFYKPFHKFFIPATVQTIESRSFDFSTAVECDSYIYCEAESKPSGWADDWNESDATVFWGIGGVDEQGVSYKLSADETYYIAVDELHSANYIIIPETYNGLPVKEIGDNAFPNKTKLYGFYIPATIEKIGENIFNNCPNLVVYLGLERHQIPVGWDNIFTNTGWLTTHWKAVGEVSDSGLVYNLSADGTYYEITACIAGGTIVIPAQYKGLPVKTIKGYAFYSNASIYSIYISNNIVEVTPYAIWECRNVTIYCEAESKPSGWADDWYGHMWAAVVWGYTQDN